MCLYVLLQTDKQIVVAQVQGTLPNGQMPPLCPSQQFLDYLAIDTVAYVFCIYDSLCRNLFVYEVVRGTFQGLARWPPEALSRIQLFVGHRNVASVDAS